jgi:WD40 repeat protein
MQTAPSKNLSSKGTGGTNKGAQKSNQISTGMSSKTRGTSSADNAGAGAQTYIILDNKNVTPKPLVPYAASKDAQKATASLEEQMQDVNIEPDAKDGDDAVDAKSDAGSEEEEQPKTPSGTSKKEGRSLSKEELEKVVDIMLVETETQTLLHFPSLCVALDNIPVHSAVSAQNHAYMQLVNSKADSDQYKEQHAQTLNNPHKMKEVLAAPPAQESVGVNASQWDIFDTFAMDPVPRHEQIQQACARESAQAVATCLKKPGCLFNLSDPSFDPSQQKEGKTKKEGDKKGAAAKSSSKPVAQAKEAAAAAASPAKPTLAAGPTVESTGSAPQGAEDQAIVAAQESEGEVVAEAAAVEEEEQKQPVDACPWKVGAGNPIPDELGQALHVMERIVSQNVFHKKHMIYRNYPTLEDLAKLDELRNTDSGAQEHRGSLEVGQVPKVSPRAEEDVKEGHTEADGIENPEADLEASAFEEQDGAKPSLQDLFCFESPQLTQGLCVTCAEWNRNNQDLLAVSYGDTAPVPNKPEGLVLFWSLKNPTYPERVIRTRSGVTALHFSTVHPNMVSAGMHNGMVAIWDLRRAGEVPVLESGSCVSTNNDRKHTDVVWETRWVDRGDQKVPRELLISVSSDGNVLQWSMKKGLEQTRLMPLKRLPNPHLGSNSVHGHREGIVFRQSSGFCIDFPRHDSSQYVVGTEDGLVHRCSTSYNEQYLDTYYGHSGPVYKVRCNPFWSYAFLTCSADWTMRLWSTKQLHGHTTEKALQTFMSTDLCDAVNDVYWAPNNSTSFAAAMDDGRVELWDLSKKPLDPIVVHFPGEGDKTKGRRKRTCVRFSPNSPVLIAGDDQGSVDVMRMYNTDVQYYSDQEQQERLLAVMAKKR